MGQLVQVNGDYSIKASSGGTILLDTGANQGFVRVTGSLLVDGDTLTVSAENLNIKDNVIVLNDGETGAGVTLEYSGIQIDRGTLTPAVFLFDEGADSWLIAEGTLESSFNYLNSNLRLRQISTDSDTDSGDLTLIGFGTGVVKVLGTTNYEQQVTNDDDIPNKKYVDDAILGNPSFQIVRGDTRITSFDTSDPIDQDFFPIGPLNVNPPESQIAIIVNNKRIVRITEQNFELRGLSFISGDPQGQDITSLPGPASVTISATALDSNLILETSGTGKVEISYALQFDAINLDNVPAIVTNTTVLYNGPIKAGTSGLYAVNNNYRDEIVLRNRAILFSMIF
jgi:hypothetical protein